MPDPSCVELVEGILKPYLHNYLHAYIDMNMGVRAEESIPVVKILRFRVQALGFRFRGPPCLPSSPNQRKSSLLFTFRTAVPMQHVSHSLGLLSPKPGLEFRSGTILIMQTSLFTSST